MTTAETYSGAERMISFAIGVGKKFVADSSDPGPDLSFQCQHQATIMSQSLVGQNLHRLGDYAQ